MQGGRSTCCDKKLSNKYLISNWFGKLLHGLVYFDNLTSIGLLFPALLLIALIDEKFKEIPLVLNIYLLLWITLNSNVGENLISAALVGLFLLFLYWSYLFIKKTEGLGLGDPILLISISLYYGFPEIFYLITISSCLLLLKIIISQKYKEQHAFGSWIVFNFWYFYLIPRILWVCRLSLQFEFCIQNSTDFETFSS